jgi:hypothetical protein
MGERGAWRRRAIVGVVVGVLAVQVGFAVNGYREPHKFFAFQMFNEASQWRAEIVRVTWTGERVPITDDWAGYDWNQLVHTASLRSPWRLRHASYGLGATVDFLDQALDWVATNTPRDRETRYIEATVTTFENARDPDVVVLRSVERAAS